MSSIVIVSMALSSLAAADSTGDARPSVAQVKTQIMGLANSYKGLPDTDGSKVATLEPLIAKLLAQTPGQSVTQLATNAIGAWHQIWGPYDQNDQSKVMSGLDPDSIYQVLSPDGTFTNVAVVSFLGPVKSLLKGIYKVESDQIAIQFTEFRVINPFSSLPSGFGLQDLPALVAADQIGSFSPTSGPPVGIKGSLHEIYSDADLRLTYGVQEGQPGRSLFVEERVTLHPLKSR